MHSFCQLRVGQWVGFCMPPSGPPKIPGTNGWPDLANLTTPYSKRACARVQVPAYNGYKCGKSGNPAQFHGVDFPQSRSGVSSKHASSWRSTYVACTAASLLRASERTSPAIAKPNTAIAATHRTCRTRQTVFSALPAVRESASLRQPWQI